ncbi:MAG TPA: phosphoribosylamine--glycine ligase [Actinomycetota bacterium]|nr:phosphoribosylamine--glycine ligase [Actinomycetota bacterium]
MRVLVVGSGAREHALVWSLSNSALVTDIVAAPGNPGIAEHAECVGVSATDLEGLLALALERKVGLVVIGPEAPLVSGLADMLAEHGIPAFGPGRLAAQLEGSKSFAKGLMRYAGVPTAMATEFTNASDAILHADRFDGRVVVKADGLAAGKGVSVCDDMDAARLAITDALEEKKFGEAGERILIEELLEGPEFSVLAFCDGKSVVPMEAAQDFKRAYDRDEGGNTGGMGSYSPVPAFTKELAEFTTDRIFEPVVAAIADQAEPYVGVLYAGLMLTRDGLKIIEFNCRFGDPETEVLLPRMDFDLCEAMLACLDGSLPGVQLKWSPQSCVCVIAASSGYPEMDAIPTGFEITGIEDAKAEGALVFHAGTTMKGDRLVTKGGRVLAVTGLGSDLASARDKTYTALSKVSFEGVRYRADIGLQAAMNS